MITIRPYVDADQDAVLRIWYDASVIAHDFMPPEFWADERQTVVEVYMPVAETWIAEEAGEPAGFIALLENEVGGLFIDPVRQRRGIGTRLLDHARVLRGGTLTVKVFKANAGARRFYERYGFAATGEGIDPATGAVEVEMTFGRSGV
ncbi:MAG: GNAT family N-acetyltransferase [Planctomycetota bacterium]|jgi:putative acetyltransferase